MAVPARAFRVSPESDQKQAEVALRFAVGEAVECYMDGCFHRGTVVALSHRNDKVMPVCLSLASCASLLALYHHQNHCSDFHKHHTDGRLDGWRRRRTRSCSMRAASSGLRPILTASSARGAPSNRHRRAAAAAAAAETRHERSAAADAAAARATPGAGAGAAIGAGAASAAPAALAAGTAVVGTAAAVTVTVGRSIDASAITRATGSTSDRWSEIRQARRLWRRPRKLGRSSPLSKK